MAITSGQSSPGRKTKLQRSALGQSYMSRVKKTAPFLIVASVRSPTASPANPASVLKPPSTRRPAWVLCGIGPSPATRRRLLPPLHLSGPSDSPWPLQASSTGESRLCSCRCACGALNTALGLSFINFPIQHPAIAQFPTRATLGKAINQQGLAACHVCARG